jgi:hypothetical protein
MDKLARQAVAADRAGVGVAVEIMSSWPAAAATVIASTAAKTSLQRGDDQGRIMKSRR